MGPKRKLLWTEEKEEELISLVREKEYLYDKMHSSFKDSIMKKNAWEGIAEKMGDVSDECEEKWKSLKKQYTDFLRKTNHPTGSGNKGPKPTFRHSDLMGFYIVCYKPYKTTSNLDDEEDENFEEDSSTVLSSPATSQDDSCLRGDQDLEIDYEGFEETDVLPQVVKINAASKKSLATKNPNQLKTRKRKSESYDDMSELDKLLLGELNATRAPKLDEFDLFLASLGPSLRNIAKKNAKKAGLVKIELQNVLLKAEFDDNTNTE